MLNAAIEGTLHNQCSYYIIVRYLGFFHSIWSRLSDVAEVLWRAWRNFISWVPGLESNLGPMLYVLKTILGYIPASRRHTSVLEILPFWGSARYWGVLFLCWKMLNRYSALRKVIRDYYFVFVPSRLSHFHTSILLIMFHAQKFTFKKIYYSTNDIQLLNGRSVLGYVSVLSAKHHPFVILFLGFCDTWGEGGEGVSLQTCLF